MKKNNKKEGKSSGDAVHVLRLFERIAIEIGRVNFEHGMRVQIRELLAEFEEKLKFMEQRDFEYSQLPDIRIKNLREELERNDELLKKNESDLRGQIQAGLERKGYPFGSAWFDSLIEKMKLDIEEIDIKVMTGFEVLNPQFRFQQIPRWVELQVISHTKQSDVIRKNLKEFEHKIEGVRQEIAEQNERIIARKSQIIEELEALGQDISEFTKKNHDYIG